MQSMLTIEMIQGVCDTYPDNTCSGTNCFWDQNIVDQHFFDNNFYLSKFCRQIEFLVQLTYLLDNSGKMLFTPCKELYT